MKRNVSFALVFLFTAFILLSGCGGKAEEPVPASAKPPEMSPEVAKIYEEAKKEGKVIYWTSDDVEMPKLIEGFNKQFPDIKVESFQLQPPQVVEKIITEANANQTNVDVFDIYYNDTKLLADRDLLKQFEWNKVFGLDPQFVRFDGRAVTGWHLSYPIIYNTNLVKENEVPKSWEDLLDPKWKGKILVEARGNAFPILSYKWGEEKTINYVKGLMKQDPIIIKGGTPSIQALANGQAAVGIGSYIYKVEDLKKQGAPLEWAKVGPLPLITKSFGVLKNAPHPNAGLLFSYWLVSEDGLKAREAGRGSARLVGPGGGRDAKTIAEQKIETIVEDPEKEQTKANVEKELIKILSSSK